MQLLEILSKSMRLLGIHVVLDQKSMKLLEIVAIPVSWAEGCHRFQ